MADFSQRKPKSSKEMADFSQRKSKSSQRNLKSCRIWTAAASGNENPPSGSQNPPSGNQNPRRKWLTSLSGSENPLSGNSNPAGYGPPLPAEVKILSAEVKILEGNG
jgi:hypothetical protein